jgi:hypothetical protein
LARRVEDTLQKGKGLILRDLWDVPVVNSPPTRLVWIPKFSLVFPGGPGGIHAGQTQIDDVNSLMRMRAI